jgi:hypothetical protein
LTNEERAHIAVSLMRHYNKVAHIFEMVKVYGSTADGGRKRSGAAAVRVGEGPAEN